MRKIAIYTLILLLVVGVFMVVGCAIDGYADEENLILNGKLGIGTDDPQSIMHIKTGNYDVTKYMASTYDENNPNKYADVFLEGEDARLNLFSEKEGGHGSSLVLAEMEKINNKFEFNDAWTICSASSNMYRNLMFIYGESTDYSKNPHIFHFTTDGKIGINKFTPSANLHIRSKYKSCIFLEADTDNFDELDTAYLKMSQDANAISSVIGHCPESNLSPDGSDFLGTISNALIVGTTSKTPLHLGTNRNVAMTIGDDSKVGIGTKQPEKLLEVSSQDNSNNFGGTASIKITNTSTSGFGKHSSLLFGYRNNIGAGISGIYTNWTSYNSGGFDLGFFTKNSHMNEEPTEKMRITAEGNVGVGTDVPNEKLTVNGALSLANINDPNYDIGYGKLYVKHDGNLYFKDEYGYEYLINRSADIGYTGSYEDGNGNTITVKNGIITNVDK